MMICPFFIMIIKLKWQSCIIILSRWLGMMIIMIVRIIFLITKMFPWHIIIIIIMFICPKWWLSGLDWLSLANYQDHNDEQSWLSGSDHQLHITHHDQRQEKQNHMYNVCFIHQKMRKHSSLDIIDHRNLCVTFLIWCHW